MQEQKNNPVFLRPRFQIDLTENKEIIINKFKQSFKNPDCEFLGKIVDHHIVIDVPKKQNHFWSPQLHIEIEEVDQTKSLLKGLFGPKPQVWTLFMFLHFGVAIIFIGFAILAYTQWMLKTDYVLSTSIVCSLPVFWFVMYFLGRIGKQTGHDQMQQIHDFMTTTLSNK